MWKLFKLIIVIFFCFTFLGLALKNPGVDVGVSTRRVKTGEVFTYKIKIEGYFSKPQLKLPEFQNFKVASHSQSKSYSFKGGKTKVMINLIYHLFATKPGVFTIEPVTIEDNGVKRRSRAIKIKVIGDPLPEDKKISPYIKKGTKI